MIGPIYKQYNHLAWTDRVLLQNSTDLLSQKDVYPYIPSHALFKSETWGSLPTVSDTKCFNECWQRKILVCHIPLNECNYIWRLCWTESTWLCIWHSSSNLHMETNDEIEPVKLVDTLSHQSRAEQNLWIQIISWDSSFPGTAAWCQSGKSGTMFARVGISAAPGSRHLRK